MNATLPKSVPIIASTLECTTDAGFLNSVANHPEVRPWLGTDGESFVDLGVLLALPGAFALQNRYGGFVFTREDEGVYEFHTQFLPEGRGQLALQAAREAAVLMFGEHGARLLKTYVPHANRAALGLVRLMGFARTHEDDANSYWQLSREAWEARAAARADTMG